MSMPAPTPPDRQPYYLRIEAAKLAAAIDAARALFKAKDMAFNTSDLIVCASVLIEMRRAARQANPPPEPPS
jgi:hypothetical protein